jgi:hypothetical protein
MDILSNISKIIRTIERNYNDSSIYYVYFVNGIQLLNILYIIILFVVGVVVFDNELINQINTISRIIICLILMIKFHPFREHILHKNDASIIFGSAVFLIINLGIMKYVQIAINTLDKTMINTYIT